MPDPLGRFDPWGPVLDDLESRVEAAETGDLTALDGWLPPEMLPRPMDDDELRRANGILGRQRKLLARLRDERADVAASMSAMRRQPRRSAASSPTPVYLDRLG